MVNFNFIYNNLFIQTTREYLPHIFINISRWADVLARPASPAGMVFITGCQSNPQFFAPAQQHQLALANLPAYPYTETAENAARMAVFFRAIILQGKTRIQFRFDTVMVFIN